jgi:hypothetical protein
MDEEVAFVLVATTTAVAAAVAHRRRRRWEAFRRFQRALRRRQASSYRPPYEYLHHEWSLSQWQDCPIRVRYWFR